MSATAPVVVVVVRHPDSANQIAAWTPDGRPVTIVDADLGSSFDGRPTDADEADTAREIAARLREGVAGLPACEARELARSWADTLEADAAEWPPEPDDGLTLVAGVLYDTETGEEAEPRCELCGRLEADSPAGFDDVDWNPETGNHATCEAAAWPPCPYCGVRDADPSTHVSGGRCKA